MKKKALLLFSGGQDSTTCLFWAINKYGKENVSTVGFLYGQKHSLEIEVAKNICKDLQIEHEIIDLSVISTLSKNALTDHEMKIEMKNGLPTTFVPGRNLMFLSFAAAIAYQKEITDIIIGVSQADFSGYPDCREDFILSMEKTLRYAMEFDFNIITPLMGLDKKQGWQLSDELGAFELIKEKTLTCYNGIIGKGCGECPSCELRNKGLEQYIAKN